MRRCGKSNIEGALRVDSKQEILRAEWIAPGIFQESKPVFNRLLGIRTFLKAATQKMGASWSAVGTSITALGARGATTTAREPLLFGGLARGRIYNG